MHGRGEGGWSGEAGARALLVGRGAGHHTAGGPRLYCAWRRPPVMPLWATAQWALVMAPALTLAGKSEWRELRSTCGVEALFLPLRPAWCCDQCQEGRGWGRRAGRQCALAAWEPSGSNGLLSRLQPCLHPLQVLSSAAEPPATTQPDLTALPSSDGLLRASGPSAKITIGVSCRLVHSTNPCERPGRRGAPPPSAAACPPRSALPPPVQPIEL